MTLKVHLRMWMLMMKTAKPTPPKLPDKYAEVDYADLAATRIDRPTAQVRADRFERFRSGCPPHIRGHVLLCMLSRPAVRLGVDGGKSVVWGIVVG